MGFGSAHRRGKVAANDEMGLPTGKILSHIVNLDEVSIKLNCFITHALPRLHPQKLMNVFGIDFVVMMWYVEETRATMLNIDMRKAII